MQTPVSNVKTVELVECPDCNKKMTKKTLKYSHAKNCVAKKVVPAVKEEEEEEEEEEGEETEETKEEPPPQPVKLKRTSSIVPAEKIPVKKTINKVKRDIATSQPKTEAINNTVTINKSNEFFNIYSRENRNERVKMKNDKMVRLFVNAI